MKTMVSLGMMLAGIATIPTSIAEETSPDIFQITAQVTVPGNLDSVVVPVTTVPTHKRLVIQTVSFFRNKPVVDIRNTKVMVETTFHGEHATLALPKDDDESSISTAFTPSATLSATVYADSGTQVFLKAFRAIALRMEPDMVFNVTISGYYVAE